MTICRCYFCVIVTINTSKTNKGEQYEVCSISQSWNFCTGLKSVLAMLAGGEREDVISVGLEDGMSADTFAENFRNAISGIKSEDEIILLGDIIGGSPMTNALEQISKKDWKNRQ